MKIIAAHLPVYLPGAALFHKLARADALLFADHLQYSKRSVINRGRIKTPEGARWLTVPVLTRGRGRQAIREVEINRNEAWARRHWRSLQTNYHPAPYFLQFADRFAAIYRREWRRLLDLNLALFETLCACLEMTKPVHLSSELALAGTAQPWLIAAIKQLGGTAYLAEASALPLPAAAFAEAGIALLSLPRRVERYHQLYGEFLADLSVVDVLFNEGRDYFR
ncbi:MAG: WbqC family protein [candidate division KSB1 bacterium]|nr:WbqC family protein [candidate division KSB1 bacterium]MDZ7274554.1 WbqC family protein [candidate division KSB1 bacterium]MDZ7284785.1 WbqC family protein [candidate division KSB1 bacterium]MDZ7297795.1 WbqC family protein [candidate division KSB1 bacterium]MDZ7306416.1 WbqC family protein [candidate division KSB1 bacterium]